MADASARNDTTRHEQAETQTESDHSAIDAQSSAPVEDAADDHAASDRPDLDTTGETGDDELARLEKMLDGMESDIEFLDADAASIDDVESLAAMVEDVARSVDDEDEHPAPDDAPDDAADVTDADQLDSALDSPPADPPAESPAHPTDEPQSSTPNDEPPSTQPNAQDTGFEPVDAAHDPPVEVQAANDNAASPAEDTTAIDEPDEGTFDSVDDVVAAESASAESGDPDDGGAQATDHPVAEQPQHDAAPATDGSDSDVETPSADEHADSAAIEEPSNREPTAPGAVSETADEDDAVISADQLDAELADRADAMIQSGQLDDESDPVAETERTVEPDASAESTSAIDDASDNVDDFDDFEPVEDVIAADAEPADDDDGDHVTAAPSPADSRTPKPKSAAAAPDETADQPQPAPVATDDAETRGAGDTRERSKPAQRSATAPEPSPPASSEDTDAQTDVESANTDTQDDSHDGDDRAASPAKSSSRSRRIPVPVAQTDNADASPKGKPNRESVLARIKQLPATLPALMQHVRRAMGQARPAMFAALEMLSAPMKLVPPSMRWIVNLLAVSLVFWVPIVWVLAIVL